ncbi:hypothetical protein [Micromonospora avicenniae]|uniref:hypothetical protein n=1 Tax=Micromonospora avicenniae TaxID=1198245 RepID=UPI0033218E63
MSGFEVFCDSVDEELRAAGLRSADLDTGEGGYAIQLGETSDTGESCALVVWSASAGLTERAYELLRSGQRSAEAVLHTGRIKHLMADAVLGILVSAGMAARLSSDDLAPATVEVLPPKTNKV